MTETFLAGSGELADPAVLAALRIGACLDLQRSNARGQAGGPRRIEVRVSDGSVVGYLPSEDSQSVADLLDAGVSVTARVRGFVPAFQRSRVQLTVGSATETGDGR